LNFTVFSFTKRKKYFAASVSKAEREGGANFHGCSFFSLSISLLKTTKPKVLFNL